VRSAGLVARHAEGYLLAGVMVEETLLETKPSLAPDDVLPVTRGEALGTETALRPTAEVCRNWHHG